MNLRIHSSDIHLTDVHTRIPFKYGIATMTQFPYSFLRLHVEIDGRRATGISADGLPPKWFTKDPARAIPEEILEMLDVIEHAAQIANGLEGESAYDIWEQLYTAQAAWGVEQNLPPLLTNFGTSLVERALLDAVCRHGGETFSEMLRSGALGIRLGDIHPSLAGTTPATWLSPHPLTHITARHTVGLLDPLTESDIAAADRVHDGLPQSLSACIERYGLRHFKIKVNGQFQADLERLRRIASVVMAEEGPDFAFSLDGNEQFKTVGDFRAFWEEANRDPRLHRFFKNLLFVEQPLHRAAALAPEVGPALHNWVERPPMIIDESDATLESLPTALELGYSGTSHKNCKGIFKGIANRCLLLQRSTEQPERSWLMSGEDLCNVGPVALLQDLAVVAALGIQSVERNGHHFVAGLSDFPAHVQELILETHGDLYAPSNAGWPTLRLCSGELGLTSINQAPLGVIPMIPVEMFPSAAEWRAAR